ncbi:MULTISPECIES: LCP family protein [unclassified Luteococcus]|uniref:LCP family protein n=1 Tax=unclassified Luteococcus TaxID=2639923 RepID=UPI00313ED904
MDSRDDSRQADLDWLYGSERPNYDKTKIMDASELAELERRRALAAGAAAAAGAKAAQRANQDNPDRAAGAGDRPSRVVHTEAEVSGARPSASKPRPRPEPAPRIPQQQAARPATAQPSTPQPRNRPAGPRPTGARGARGRGRKPWLRWLLIALAAWLVWLVVVPLIALTSGTKVKEQPDGERPGQQPGTTTLLVGSDAREALTKEQQAQLGTGTETGKRTDTMMLLYTPPSGKPVLVSLPRDSYVEIPGHGRNKLNSAYSLGGPQLLVKTVEQDTGLRVDNYMEIGFDGFAGVVDALGGITMCLDKPMVDKDSHTNLPAGCQNLNGTNALGYVRMRKADPMGDLGRMKRQREMIGAIMKKATSPWTFINPVRYWRLNMAGAHAVGRGEDTGLGDVASAANAMRAISSGEGLTLAVPVSNPDAHTQAGSSVLWDDEKAGAMFGKMAQGDTSGLEQYAK